MAADDRRRPGEKDRLRVGGAVGYEQILDWHNLPRSVRRVVFLFLIESRDK